MTQLLLGSGKGLLLTPQTHTAEHREEKQNAIYRLAHKTPQKAAHSYSPQGNTQPPNSLRLQTNRLGRPNPRLIVDLPTDRSNVTVQMRRECIRRRILVPQLSQRRTLQVGQGLAHHHRDDDEPNKKEQVEGCAGEEGEDVIQEEDCGDYAVYYCDAGLLSLDVSWEEELY
jgi:hypothetical protein